MQIVPRTCSQKRRKCPNTPAIEFRSRKSPGTFSSNRAHATCSTCALDAFGIWAAVPRASCLGSMYGVLWIIALVGWYFTVLGCLVDVGLSLFVDVRGLGFEVTGLWRGYSLLFFWHCRELRFIWSSRRRQEGQRGGWWLCVFICLE